MSNLNAYTWDRLASDVLKGTESSEAIHSQTISYALTVHSFSERETFDPLGEPWCYGRGDVKANLAVLKTQPRPTGSKAWLGKSSERNRVYRGKSTLPPPSTSPLPSPSSP